MSISGGGAYGAFGAGFFESWGEIESGPFVRPEFDVIVGVSTGVLIAPFAFIGTDEAYTSAADFYANPEPNWIKKRRVISLLPSRISMFNNCHLQDTARRAIDSSMIEALARVADGGATFNLAMTNFPGPDGAVARFKVRHPEAPLPKIRVWVVVNQQLKPQHAITDTNWISISGRALATLTSTGQLFARTIVKETVRAARSDQGMDAELYLVSIPNDAPRKTTKKMFDQQYMLQLEDLGRKMGADPSSRTDEIPSAYRVEGEWIEPDDK